jgi:hypothetical protein
LRFTKEDLNIAFSIAVSSHYYHIMKLLLDIGEVNPKGTGRSGVPWIFLAAGGESYGELYPKKAVETLIEHGAEPDLFYDGHTLISYSILHQELERTSSALAERSNIYWTRVLASTEERSQFPCA